MSERITPAREHQPAAVHEHQAPAPERTHSLEQQQHEHAQQVFGDLRSKLEEKFGLTYNQLPPATAKRLETELTSAIQTATSELDASSQYQAASLAERTTMEQARLMDVGRRLLTDMKANSSLLAQMEQAQAKGDTAALNTLGKQRMEQLMTPEERQEQLSHDTRELTAIYNNKDETVRMAALQHYKQNLTRQYGPEYAEMATSEARKTAFGDAVDLTPRVADVVEALAEDNQQPVTAKLESGARRSLGLTSKAGARHARRGPAPRTSETGPHKGGRHRKEREAWHQRYKRRLVMAGLAAAAFIGLAHNAAEQPAREPQAVTQSVEPGAHGAAQPSAGRMIDDMNTARRAAELSLEDRAAGPFARWRAETSSFYQQGKTGEYNLAAPLQYRDLDDAKDKIRQQATSELLVATGLAHDLGIAGMESGDLNTDLQNLFTNRALQGDVRRGLQDILASSSTTITSFEAAAGTYDSDYAIPNSNEAAGFTMAMQQGVQETATIIKISHTTAQGEIKTAYYKPSCGQVVYPRAVAEQAKLDYQALITGVVQPEAPAYAPVIDTPPADQYRPPAPLVPENPGSPPPETPHNPPETPDTPPDTPPGPPPEVPYIPPNTPPEVPDIPPPSPPEQPYVPPSGPPPAPEQPPETLAPKSADPNDYVHIDGAPLAEAGPLEEPAQQQSAPEFTAQQPGQEIPQQQIGGTAEGATMGTGEGRSESTGDTGEQAASADLNQSHDSAKQQATPAETAPSADSPGTEVDIQL